MYLFEVYSPRIAINSVEFVLPLLAMSSGYFVSKMVLQLTRAQSVPGSIPGRNSSTDAIQQFLFIFHFLLTQ